MARAAAEVSLDAGERRIERYEAAFGKALDGTGLGRATEVLREVTAVPTIFPQLDQTLGVGGWPIDRFGLVHGESNAGKTELVLGLLLSFLRRGHAAFFVDAERSTPIGWVRKLMGPFAESPLFRVIHPDTYEETIDAVDRWAETIAELREKGKVPKETTGLCAVDSMRKLTPKNLLAAVLAEDADAEKKKWGKAPGGYDGAGGRSGQIRAKVNAAWCDRLTSLLHRTRTALVAITRERVVDAGGSGSKFGAGSSFEDEVVTEGGVHLFFESSVVVRVTEAGAVLDEGKRIVADRHRMSIRKTKIAGKLVRYPDCFFWTSSGLLTPYGFDGARDLLELGEQLGSVDAAGAWLSFEGERLGQGRDAATKALASNPELFARVDAATRRLFMPLGETAAPAPIGRRAKKEEPSKKKGKGKKR